MMMACFDDVMFGWLSKTGNEIGNMVRMFDRGHDHTSGVKHNRPPMTLCTLTSPP